MHVILNSISCVKIPVQLTLRRITFEPGDLIKWLFWPPASSFGKTPAFFGKTPADVAVVSPGISYTFRQGFIAETWIEPLTCEDGRDRK